MANSRHRVVRGFQSQEIWAEYLCSQGFTVAKAPLRGANGVDILLTPGISWEIKAVDDKDFRWRASLREAGERPGVPVVVARGRGCGPSNVGDWPMIIAGRFGVPLLRRQVLELDI